MKKLFPHIKRSYSVFPRWIRWMAACLGILVLGILILDYCFPLPPPGRDAPYATLVVARDGTPLRVFPDQEYVWRYPVTIDEVSPQYIETLLNYEDRGFWWHFGVNPFSMVRAGWQRLAHGRIISGGSTLTMQVARIIDPTPRTVRGKIRQMLRAVQLELHYSKKEILTLYLNYVPMGGVLEGVESASRAYLGKPASRLTSAEAALLTVLPQSPSRLRPDRFPHKAQAARDKVIERMRGKWTDALVQDALTEPVIAQTVKDPMLAPLYAERVKKMRPGALRIDSTIDAGMQQAVELLLMDRTQLLPPKVSLAAIVMENNTLEVLAYAGSADFSDSQRYNYLDMVQASRSPGSALKPFLYGLAIDEGLIHSESLLSDTPQSFSGYQPGNFLENFNGPVSVSDALVRSLNVPAVAVLDHYGSEKFVAQLRQGGLKMDFPRGASPNLSVVLGGAGVTLENLVGSYSAFARAGIAGKPRLLPDEPVVERRMMSEGAAFIIRDILESGGPVSRAMGGARGDTRGVAYKTGTSFGFRDAWSVGVNDRYTVGVWVGRPDGTPNPGFFGANVAAPLLLSIFDALPGEHQSAGRQPPASVRQKAICWPSGTLAPQQADTIDAAQCPQRRMAWLLNDIAPPTFAEAADSGPTAHTYTYFVDKVSEQRVMPDCTRDPYEKFETARWPSSLIPWLAPSLRQLAVPPEWSPGCAKLYRSGGEIRIVGANNGELIKRAAGGKSPTLRLSVRGVQSSVNWVVNGKFAARTEPGASHLLTLNEAGRYDITALEENGRYDRIGLTVIDTK